MPHRTSRHDRSARPTRGRSIRCGALGRTAGAIAVATGLLLSACSSTDEPAAPSTAPATSAGQVATSSTTAPDGAGDPPGPEPVSAYDDPTNWLCRPDLTDDACDIDLTATLVRSDGTTEVQPFVPATDPPIDCFYVYPTVSADDPPNADRSPGDEERNVIANQFARFAEVCRTFAPLYRQIPVRGLAAFSGGSTTTVPGVPAPGDVAYGDVLEAWQHYLRNDGGQRPFVLIGHSQGAGHLRRLVAEQIDGDEALRDRMVSAMLIGGGVPAPGSPGAFENVPPCTAADQTGCVLSYATFDAAAPPPENSFFGRLRGGGGRVICTNPADLAGGSGPLDSYYGSGVRPGTTTPWVRLEGWWDGRCASDERTDWLEVTSTWTPGDQRPERLGGLLTPEWGLHLVDVNVAIGNLVDLVRTQSGQG